MCRNFLIFVLVTLFINYGYAEAQKKNSSLYVNQIQKKGYLSVGMVRDDQYPFFFKTAGGKLEGLDLRLALRIAKALNVKLKVDRSPQSFNDLIPFVVNGKVDLVISKLSKTLERSKSVLFSDPYIVFRQSLLLSRVQLAKISSNDEEVINALRLFRGKIGVIKDSSYERYAKINFPQADILAFDTWSGVLDALNANEVFGIYRDEMEILKYVKQNSKANLYFKSVVLKDKQDPIAIAVPAQANHLLYFVNFVLESMKDEIPHSTKELLQEYSSYSAYRLKK